MSVIGGAESLSSDAVGLAGKPSSDDVDGTAWLKRANVVMSWYLGPVAREHLPAEGVNLYLPGWRSQTGSLESQIK